MKRFCYNSAIILCAIFPLGLAALLSGWNFFGCPGSVWGHSYEFYFLPRFSDTIWVGLLGLLAYTIVVSSFCKCMARLKNHANGETLVVISIFFLSIVIRALIPLLVQDRIALFSDFHEAWQRAVGESIANDRHQFFPAYVNFALFLKLTTSVFGEKVIVDILSGIIFNGISSVLIYKLAQQIFNNRLTPPLFVSGLYIFNPALIVYAMTGTPEHMCIAFVLLSTLLFTNTLNNINRNNVCILVSSAIALGIGTSVKPFHALVLLSMLIVLGFAIFKTLCWKHLVSFSSRGIILVATTLLTISAITKVSEKLFDLDFSNLHVETHFLNVGLRPDGEGQVHLGHDGRKWIEDLQRGTKPSKVDDAITLSLKKSWCGRLPYMPEFLAKKMVWAWQDFNMPLSYINILRGETTSQKYRTGAKGLLSYIIECLMTTSQLSYFSIMAITAMALLFRLYKTRLQSLDYIRLFLSLIVFGFACMLLISEAQSRYKCLILPFIFILSGDALPLFSRLRNSRKIKN